MTTALLATLPLQLLCHLIVGGVPEPNDSNFVANPPAPQVQITTLTEDYAVPRAKAALLASIPLELLCQLVATNNLTINKNGALALTAEIPTQSPLEIISEENSTSQPEAESTTIFESEAETTQISNGNLPDGYVSFPEDHAAYKLISEQVSWNEARDRCVSEGARLATPDSVEKINHIHSLNNDLNHMDWIHVGIYHSHTTGEWVRVDNGLPVTSVQWASFQESPHDEGCAGIPLSEGGLVSYPCDWSFLFVCEISM